MNIMTYFAQRTVIKEDNSKERPQGTSVSLTNFSDSSAYVLIGDPGAGKTTAFKRAADSQGGVYVTARDFPILYDEAEWRGKVLYIDGLDETRAGSDDGRTSLDQIRAKLRQLGCPKFRLSCRWADWFGPNDRKHLKKVSSDKQVTVLHLEPLSKQNIKDILCKNFDIEDTDGFIATARERGIDALLNNPQTLGMLAESVSAGKWPKTRKETFELACEKLLTEVNDEHLIANPSNRNIPQLIKAAGRLCAVQILTGGAGYTLQGRALPDRDYPALEEIRYEEKSYANQVLGTRLFSGSTEGRLVPAHRQISEFLAARYVAGLIDEGLPLDRVLALITGFDGDVLSQFRVFIPWLAVHSKPSRKRISQIDPSGMIYIGDAQDYSIDEKRDIVKNLRRESYWNPGCLRSIRRTSGIGDIVVPELEETFREILSDTDRELAHQSYVMMLLGMLADGEALPGLSDLLQQIVRDNAWNPGVRGTALDVLVKQNEQDHLDASILLKILEDIESGTIYDPEDELLGIVLQALYPNMLSVAQVLPFLREPKNTASTGEYSRFWTSHVVKKSSRDQLIQFLDALVERIDDYKSFFVGEIGANTRLGQLPTILLSRFLEIPPAENIPVKRLFNWLLAVSDPELNVSESQRIEVRFRLEWKQEVLKRLIAHGVDTCSDSENFWECIHLVERSLFGARPWDFATWCLDQALIATDKNAAHYYIDQVAERVFSGQDAAGLTSETVRGRIFGNADLMAFFDQKISDLESPSPQATDAQRPEATEDTQDQRNGEQSVPELYELATSDDHKEIARLAALLKAALLNCEWSQLIEIIERKLSDSDADSMERVYWLTAGFVIAPEKYGEELETHVSSVKPRHRVLMAVMDARRNTWITISNLIRELSSDPSPEATESLETLSSNANLAPWYPTIVNELHRQTNKRREAEFQYCNIREVVKVLDNRSPANAADLAALVVNIIEDLARQIRDGSTSDWRQYWNVDSYNRPTDPKPEDAGRDALLSDLQGRVNYLDIDAQREGSYAEDNRADIRVSSGNFNVPVEIKKSCHPDLWTAIKNQLITKYSRDPGAEGYGIYLVFWFGDTEKCRPTPGPNLTPQNAEKLKSGLLDTLTEGERRKISVCVIDVSKP